MSKILFWFLFVYLEIYTLSVSAISLLVVVLATTAAILVLRSTAVGRRPNLIVLNGAIAICLFWSAIQQDDMRFLADGACLLALLSLEIAHRRRALLFAIALEHVAGLLFSPWSLLSIMKDSPLIAGQATARAFAVALAVAIALRRHEREPDPERVMPMPTQPTHRPLTVAEWEARHSRDRP